MSGSTKATRVMVGVWLLAVVLSAFSFALFVAVPAEVEATGVFLPAYVHGWAKVTFLAALGCGAVAAVLRHRMRRPWIRFGPPLGNLATTIFMVGCIILLLAGSHVPARLVRWQAARDCRLGVSAPYRVTPACELASRLAEAY